MTIEIGKLITEPQEKDAIHCAVAPVVAGHNLLYAGNHIGFVKDDNRTVGATASRKIGIVDPFLTQQVRQGEQFWMFLYPNTIQSLRHDWTHPSFTKTGQDKQEAINWITKWAARYGMDFAYAMKCGHAQDFFIGEVYYDQIPTEFWAHFETLTGIKVSEDTRENTHFHCAC